MACPGEGMALHHGRIGFLHRRAHFRRNKAVRLTVEDENGHPGVLHRPEGIGFPQVKAPEHHCADEDKGLYEEHTSNKKAQDLKNRCNLINDIKPDCVVSIHQNSYHEEYVNGAQVFYYRASMEGKALAEEIQTKMVSYLDPENHRKAKANDSYYLLKKTAAPIVIVECGFLSNWEEAKKLQMESYQSQAAWAVAMGIMQYLE